MPARQALVVLAVILAAAFAAATEILSKREDRPGLQASIALFATATLAAILSAFLMFVRPWYLRWGATDAEASRALPGDEIVPDAAGQETRAITIHAPPTRGWASLAHLLWKTTSAGEIILTRTASLSWSTFRVPASFFAGRASKA